MAEVLGELEALYSKNSIGAVSISIVNVNGSIRNLCCVQNRHMFSLLTATDMAHRLMQDRVLGENLDRDEGEE